MFPSASIHPITSAGDGGVPRRQASLPHLLQYLWDRYVEEHREAAARRWMEGPQPQALDLARELASAPVGAFLSWASDFLQRNRVVENFFVDFNHGVRLSNNDTLVICPGTHVPGTMQECHAIAVTGSDAPGQDTLEGNVSTFPSLPWTPR